jgi:hypothetical protein
MLRARVRATSVAAATALTVALGGLAVTTAPAASAATSGTTLRISITPNGMYVDGPRSFPAGRVHVYVDASLPDRGVEIARFARGYHFADFRADLKTAFTELGAGHMNKGLAALNHALDHSTFFGGVYAPDGAVRHGTLLLPRAGGRYVLFDDSGNLPKRPVHLTLTSPRGPQTLPATDKTVVAKTIRRWAGDDTLPAHGNITFHNAATNSPHFLVLQHVKAGTTRHQVINALTSPTPPTFIRQGEQESDSVGPGHSMVLHLNLPKGTYAQMCFFPDPETGMPHALMGMVRMVRLT